MSSSPSADYASVALSDYPKKLKQLFGAHLDDAAMLTVFRISRTVWTLLSHPAVAIRLPPNEKDLPQAFKDRLAKNSQRAAQPGDYIVFEWSAEGATVGMALSADVFRQAGWSVDSKRVCSATERTMFDACVAVSQGRHYSFLWFNCQDWTQAAAAEVANRQLDKHVL